MKITKSGMKVFLERNNGETVVFTEVELYPKLVCLFMHGISVEQLSGFEAEAFTALLVKRKWSKSVIT